MGRIDTSRFKQRAKKGLTVVEDLTKNLGHKAKKVIDKSAYRAKSAAKKFRI